jgi:hypothetical protein
MFKGRTKKVAVAAGASVLMAMTSLAVVPLVASASTTGTTTSVTATPAATTTGHAVTIAAKVAPVTTDAATLAGTVTFTITGSDSSTISCKNPAPAPVNHAGKATCLIPAGTLLAAASPYTASGTFTPSNANYSGSTGSTSVAVTKARTHTKLKGKPAVQNHTANVFTASIKAGGATKLIGGEVRFTVVSKPGPTNPHKLICAGGDLQPVAVSGNVATATCSLQAGWFVVPPKTKTDKHPVGTYGVSAVYLGNGSFLSSQKTKQGSVG